MLIVIPVSNHDKELIEDFCNVINFFGPYKKHTLLVVVRPADKTYGLELFEKIEKQFCESNIYVFENDGPLGWPQGPNFYWKSTIEYLINIKNNSPWFWMELDCTPVKNNWADLLEEEYITSGKKCLGIVYTPPNKKINLTHLVGVAVYPANFHLICSSWKEINENSIAFDAFCAKETVPISKNSKLMQHNFRTMKYDCTEEGVKGIVNSEIIHNDSFDKSVDNKTVLVHGCMDGSLARIITNTQNIDKIPVYLHIPKSAGTYIVTQTYNMLNYWSYAKNKNNDIARFDVTHGNYIVLSLNGYVLDYKNNKNFKPGSRLMEIEISSFIEELRKGHIHIFSMAIEAQGFWLLRQKLIDLICDILNKKPLYYTIFRNEYDKNQSLYNYLTSNESYHELTHNLFTSKDFAEHIKSPQFSNNWLTRQITGILNPNIDLTEEHFNFACSVLDKFKIQDIKNVDQLLDDVFKECYCLTTKNTLTNYEDVFKNKTSKAKTDFFALDEETKKIFLSKTDFDRRLYQKYCDKEYMSIQA